jgi:chromosomal replication initiation ATPase DnaA
MNATPYSIPGLKFRKPIRKNDHNKYEMIITIVSQELDISRPAMMSKNRQRELVYGRHMAMKLIRDHVYGSSLKQVGEYFKRDHTTVIHASRALQDLIETDSSFSKHYRNIEQRVIESL